MKAPTIILEQWCLSIGVSNDVPAGRVFLPEIQPSGGEPKGLGGTIRQLLIAADSHIADERGKATIGGDRDAGRPELCDLHESTAVPILTDGAQLVVARAGLNGAVSNEKDGVRVRDDESNRITLKVGRPIALYKRRISARSATRSLAPVCWERAQPATMTSPSNAAAQIGPRVAVYVRYPVSLRQSVEAAVGTPDIQHTAGQHR
jgi:hypothetical protein